MFSSNNTRVLLGITAALLLLGSATFAATTPGGSRPRVSDLPVISVSRDVEATGAAPVPAPLDVNASPTPDATDTAGLPANPTRPETPSTPKPGHPTATVTDDDDDREVVSPPIRDDDPDGDSDSDDVGNGESSSHVEEPETD
ncbi:MAG: hypothetical protein D9V44_10645 [Actinobacteria bacterium]|nr:MAG: hypothetical protein D9V44_10645 [Actinomycetota bacterium]